MRIFRMDSDCNLHEYILAILTLFAMHSNRLINQQLPSSVHNKPQVNSSNSTLSSNCEKAGPQQSSTDLNNFIYQSNPSHSMKILNILMFATVFAADMSYLCKCSCPPNATITTVPSCTTCTKLYCVLSLSCMSSNITDPSTTVSWTTVCFRTLNLI